MRTFIRINALSAILCACMADSESLIPLAILSINLLFISIPLIREIIKSRK